MISKRLLVSLDKDIFDKIENLAHLRHKSLSSVAKELILYSLDLEEDQFFSKKADERLKKISSWTSHEDAWK